MRIVSQLIAKRRMGNRNQRLRALTETHIPEIGNALFGDHALHIRSGSGENCARRHKYVTDSKRPKLRQRKVLRHLVLMLLKVYGRTCDLGYDPLFKNFHPREAAPAEYSCSIQHNEKGIRQASLLISMKSS